MKKSHSITLTAGLFLMTAFVASGCVTNNFCNAKEQSRILFASEPGVSEYFATKEEAGNIGQEKIDLGYKVIVEQVYEDNPNLWRRVELDQYDMYTKSAKLSEVIKAANLKNIARPTPEYLTAFDTKLLTVAIGETKTYQTSTITYKQANEVLTNYGFIKFFSGEDKLWGNYDLMNAEIALEFEAQHKTNGHATGMELCPTTDYVNLYKTTLNTYVNQKKSCIATVEGTYGNYGKTYSDDVGVTIEAKDWAYAWQKGPVSGLIVFPVAWLTDTLSIAFAGGANTTAMMEGWPQLLALVIVTILVRLFIFGATFKSVLTQQKMTALQPELAKIQAKYPNSNTNQSEKQRLAEEQMKLYKKNKVNPMSQLLVMLIQFPIFIGVWGAMSGSAVLSTGSFLGLDLSTSIKDALMNVSTLPGNNGGWWTALVLFILMSAGQFLAMKLPQWIAKAKTKKVAKLSANPAQTQQNKTMNIVSYGMLILIIFMGFSLPAAMGVYWLIGAIFSLAQSLITQLIVSRKKHKK